MMIWDVILATLMLVGIIYFAWELWKQSYKLSYLPSTKSVPWLGMTAYLPTKPTEQFKFLNDLDERLKHYCTWLGPLPVIRSAKIEFVEEIIKSKIITSRCFIFKLGQSLFGDSVLTLTGSAWKERKHLLSPAFHFDILNKYTEIFNVHAKDFSENLEKINQQPVEIQAAISECTLRIICETAMGIYLKENTLGVNYLDALHNMKKEFEQRLKKPWLWIDIFFKISSLGKSYNKHLEIMENFTVAVINEKIRERSEGRQKENSSLVDILLDAYDNDKIDYQGIISEVNMFMFAGHDTTASALSWILYFIGLHPIIQKKLYKEIISCNENFTTIKDQADRAAYLDMVIKESLRLCPPLGTYTRVIETDANIDGNPVCKGTTIFMLSHAIQKDSQFWSNPLKFDPERFNKQNSQGRRPFTYIPFSAGPRNCIGQRFAMLEMKVILFEFLAKFEIVTMKQNVEICTNIILCSENGIWLKFKKRK